MISARWKNERNGKDDVEKEFEKIDHKHKFRVLRGKRSENKRMEQNLKAKEGMQKLRNNLGKRLVIRRIMQNKSEINDWNSFMKTSKVHAEMITKKKPDIVEMINEKNRDKKELISKREEKNIPWKLKG